MSFDDVKIYDTVPRAGLPAQKTDTDYIVFGSSFGAESFFEKGCTLGENVKAVCIGEPTAETVKKYTDNYIITAEPHTARGAADAVKKDATGI